MEPMNTLTPRQTVAELDRYIIGQDAAKKSVAIALRNRWRRQQVPLPLREEIAPKNIIMIGPTGVGKTEIARRLASLAQSPFLKVEASKFTEVGYVGRDVESMIRDLLDLAINMVREEAREQVTQKAAEQAQERMLDLLVPPRPAPLGQVTPMAERSEDGGRAGEPVDSTREKFRQMLKDGKLDERQVEMEIDQASPMPMIEILSHGGSGLDDMESGLKDVFGKMFPKKTQRQQMPVKDAMEVLKKREA
ncbi:MAG: HslU--HslV peptidase ATPase subunit, partial [Deltaproteobacteria bacterium HGW-Deltaproteobacteria-16]